MFDNVLSIKLYVSDFHMGEGAHSLHEDFKYHELGIPMENTKRDFVLDKYFFDFVNWIIENLNHCPDVQLCLNGDIFDFSAVADPNKSNIAFPYEKAALSKLRVIIRAHPIFFKALGKFCAQPNTTLKFFHGNHDWELNWESVQKMITERVSPKNNKKIFFLYEETANGTYCRHGENEPSIKSNHKKPIITYLDLLRLPAALKKAKLNFALREVLDVPLSYYLLGYLMYNLKPYNYLMGRMHTHGFVWLDAIKNLGRRSWYRRRSFPIYAALYFFRTLVGHLLFVRFWHIKMKASLKKIIQLLWWTITGVLTGTTSRDSAIKVLHSREDVECVIHSHEHKYSFEVIQIDNHVKTYMNTGTWMPQIKTIHPKAKPPWKRFTWLQKFFGFMREFFVTRQLKIVWKCPVGLETINEDGKISRRLTEWNKEEKTLRQMS